MEDDKFSSVVGLDLSLSGTGMARIYKNNLGLFREIFFIPTKVSDGSRIERCLNIFNAIKERSKVGDLFFIEDYAFGISSKQSQLATLGELGGIIKLKIFEWTGKEPMPISQGQWKKFLSGVGNLKKDAFKLAIYKKFNIECKTNDEAAALGVADFAWNLSSDQKRSLCKYEEDVIKTFWKNHRIEDSKQKQYGCFCRIFKIIDG